TNIDTLNYQFASSARLDSIISTQKFLSLIVIHSSLRDISIVWLRGDWHLTFEAQFMFLKYDLDHFYINILIC
ncbi:MAG: hypothetical protein QGD96_11625, partial [Anaerolineae bacterium]|nr:hypothetical protein [Anaerolineae bacterium]